MPMRSAREAFERHFLHWLVATYHGTQVDNKNVTGVILHHEGKEVEVDVTLEHVDCMTAIKFEGDTTRTVHVKVGIKFPDNVPLYGVGKENGRWNYYLTWQETFLQCIGDA